MEELEQILEVWTRLEGRGEAVLATVIDVKGSAYRRPGARMLITSRGERCGSISGGCLEAEAAKEAWRLTGGGEAVVREYDTTSPDDAVFGFGLGCNGVVRVLLERLGTSESRGLISFLKAIRRERKPGVVATIIDSPRTGGIQIGDRLMMSADEVITIGLNDDVLRRALCAAAREVLNRKESQLFYCETMDGRVEVFVEFVSPPVPLVIFGAGQDAMPLAQIAKELGWHVTVVDWRAAYANFTRFSNADAIVLARPEEAPTHVILRDDTAALLMNHNFSADLAILEHLLGQNLPYIGVLGPAARTRRMLDELGIQTPPGNLYAPAGLDIGGNAPATIALAICAEIQAVLAGRTGRSLRERRGPINPRPAELVIIGAVPLEVNAWTWRRFYWRLAHPAEWAAPSSCCHMKARR